MNSAGVNSTVMKAFSLSRTFFVVFSALMLVFSTVSHAQAPAMNIEGTSNSILSKLDKALTLTDVQKPRLLTIITNYLRQKVNIQPLQQSNEKAYATKLNSMQNGLQTKLKAVLSQQQYADYQALKPKTFDETNVLSHLFY